MRPFPRSGFTSLYGCPLPTITLKFYQFSNTSSAYQMSLSKEPIFDPKSCARFARPATMLSESYRGPMKRRRQKRSNWNARSKRRSKETRS